jgi:hypothetical protein
MITLFWTVFFCLGWNLTLGEHQIFNFIRKPFDGLDDIIENKKELYKVFPKKYLKRNILFLEMQYFIVKPLILCITCMASIWGVAVFVILEGFNISLIPYLILNCFAASFLQTFIWSFYVRYIQ